jgi:hypothetical protein
MSILLNDNLSIQAPKATDSRYGPYVNVATALTSVILANRYLGLTVGIGSSTIVEYWFKDGTADSNLILKVDNTANTSSANTIYTQGVDVSQNARMVIIEGTDVSQNVRLDYSNSTITIIQGVDTSQNSRMVIIEGVDATQNTNISNKLNLTGSLNQTVSGNVTISQDLIVAGNLVLTGNINTQNVQQLAVADPLIILGIGNYVSDTKDIGFAAHYNDGTNAHAGLIRDADTKEFYVFQGYIPELDANNNVNITDPSFRTSNLNTNYIKGNLIATTATVNGIDLSTYTQATYAQANVTIGVDATQNNRLTVIENNNLSQNTRLDYSNTAITIIQGTDVSQNARMAIIEGVDTSQNARMVIIEGTDASQNVRLDYSNSAITILQGVDVGQNTAIAATDGKMSSSYNQANTGTVLAQAAYVQANVTIGVDATQNTRLNSIETINSNQNTTIGIIQGVDVSQNNRMTISDGVNVSQNVRLDYSNTAITIIQGVDLTQNTRLTVSEGVDVSQNVRLDYSNAAITITQGVDATQNTRLTSIETVNTNQNTTIAIIQGVDLGQNAAITSVNQYTQSAYDHANTKFSSSGGTITGSVIITNNLTVDGNLTFTGNVTSVQVTGNSGQFFGEAANGFNALYAGIPVGYLTQPQIVQQITSDYDGYAGFNMQNINTGANSSSDFFITADNGSFLDGFLDLGLAGSNYNYEGFSILGPNDGYLFVTGNTSTGGGDLILGTQLQNDVIFSLGGLNTENEVMRITSANNVIIKSTNPSTSNTTGALTVVGGVGVAGNVYANALYDNGTRVLTYLQGVDATQNTNIISLQTQANTLLPNTGSLITTNGTSQVYIANNSLAFNSTTGALQVAGGISANNLNIYNGSSQSTIAGSFYLTGGNLNLGNYGGGNSFHNLGHGSTISGATKYITIGQFGLAGSNTNINIGSAAGTSNVTFNTATTLYVSNTFSSYSTTNAALTVAGSVGVANSIYVGNRVGFANSNNISVMYQTFNPATSSFDIVLG